MICRSSSKASLSQLVEIRWHLVDLRVEVVLDLLDELSIFRQHEVNRSSLLAETTSSTDSVDVVLLSEWKLVVDDQANLLHINTSSEQISCDEHANGSLTELLHDDVSLDLVHLSVHDRDGEVLFGHDLFEFLDTLLCVAINESLVNIKVGIKIE